MAEAMAGPNLEPHRLGSMSSIIKWLGIIKKAIRNFEIRILEN